ncbi:MAG TPA: plastocyanin/azurin family copper-binding protein [Candidatus Limnocylindrales bacterium]|nr:plastocyanin/azurin family copper-binding protein [Candidatus Limnocylindrales bacterium]
MIATGVGILISHFLFHDLMGNSNHHKKDNQNSNVVRVDHKQDSNTIEIKKYAFTPEKKTVKKGTTVTWINYDIAPHTVTIDEETREGPKSKFFGKGEKYTYTFNEVGIYPYHCEPHPYMKAMIEVTE